MRGVGRIQIRAPVRPCVKRDGLSTRRDVQMITLLTPEDSRAAAYAKSQLPLKSRQKSSRETPSGSRKSSSTALQLRRATLGADARSSCRLITPASGSLGEIASASRDLPCLRGVRL